MKKAIILSLVLGVVSLACAGIEIIPGLEYEVSGNTVMISAMNWVGFNFNLQADDCSVLSDIWVYPGNIGYIWPPKYWYPEYCAALGLGASTGTSGPVSGTIVSFDFESTAEKINFFYSPFAGGSEIVIGGQVIDLTGYSMTVPEPATVSLISLGGLFLAYRRK